MCIPIVLSNPNPNSRITSLSYQYQLVNIRMVRSVVVLWCCGRASVRRCSLRVVGPSRKVMNRSPILATLLRPLAFLNLASYGSLRTATSKVAGHIRHGLHVRKF